MLHSHTTSKCLLLLLLPLFVMGCGNKVPEHVIQPKAMEDLLYDIHISEAYLERGDFTISNEYKDQVRRSVLSKHHVEEALLDTSLVWYGNNLEEYVKIYDNIAIRLKQEDDKLKRLIAESNAQVLTEPGDSVSIWKKESFYAFNANATNRLVSFDIAHDKYFKPGDTFLFKAYFVTASPQKVVQPMVTLSVEYGDNRIVSITENVSQNGWFEMPLTTEPTAISRVYGHILVPETANQGATIYADSIAIVRIHPTGDEGLESR